eukprot:1881517-Alexandrium_andersonii.AAC.1
MPPRARSGSDLSALIVRELEQHAGQVRTGFRSLAAVTARAKAATSGATSTKRPLLCNTTSVL